MILTIWRHGQAGTAVVDSERELTETGLDDISFGSDQFHQQCKIRQLPMPGLILFSRWMRTAQTAEIIGRQFTKAAIHPSESLIPGCQPGNVDQMLETQRESLPDHVLLVSHQPLVSTLVDYYLGERGRVASLAPGGLAMLKLDVIAGGCGECLFSAQPPEYRALA